METTEFLDAVLGDEGHYCILAIHADSGKRIQKFYDTRDKLLHAAGTLDSNEYNVYFALGTLEEPGSREAKNVKHLKSFFLDLDCGDEEKVTLGAGYTTKQEAVLHLRDFCTEYNLSKPLLVDSGRGIHAYWPLTEPVARDNWTPVAVQFKATCREYGLAIDPAVPADAARVLRVPGTHNFKSNPPSDVLVMGKTVPRPTDLDKFASCIGFDPDSPPVLRKPKQELDSSFSATDDLLAGNINARFKNILQKSAARRGCEQLVVIATDQENISEPLWRAGLSIAKFCSDGTEAAHRISRKHPGYSEEETEIKLEGILGPYHCETFDSLNPNVCHNCPHYGKIKSPIVLGNEVQEASEEDNVVEVVGLSDTAENIQKYVIPKYPKPYFRGKNGGVYRRIDNGDGDFEDKLIYHNDLYVVKRLKDQELGECVVLRLHLPKDGVNEFTVPLTTITSREEFRKAMSAQGVAVLKMDPLMQYTADWINELQAMVEADEARRQYGWTKDCKSFVLGDKEYTRDGRILTNHKTTATAATFSAFEPKGTMAEWRKAMAFFNRKGMEIHQYVIYASFGSVLMEMIPNIASVGLHLYHKESGTGKTTALYAGMTAWGNYKQLVLDDQDTPNFRFNRGEVYKNLPLFVDEVTNTRSEELSGIAYQLTGGAQRGRLTRNANVERLRGDPWSMLSCTTGNTSFIERVALTKSVPKAEAQRIMEIQVKPHQFIPKAETDELNKRLENNYGHAGIEFVRYVLANFDDVQTLLEDIQRKIDDKLDLTSMNRFWSAGVAATVTAAVICNQLNLLNFNLRRLMGFVEVLVEENRRSTLAMSMSIEEVLSNYLAENHGNILRLKSTHSAEHDEKFGTHLDNYVMPDFDPRGRIVARYETDTKHLYLMPNPLRDWCVKQQINYTSFITDIREKLGAKSVRARLGKGTKIMLPQLRVLFIDCSNIDTLVMAAEADQDEPATAGSVS